MITYNIDKVPYDSEGFINTNTPAGTKVVYINGSAPGWSDCIVTIVKHEGQLYIRNTSGSVSMSRHEYFRLYVEPVEIECI